MTTQSAPFTNYTINKFLIDNFFRAAANAPPANLFFGLFIASKGFAAVSTTYTVGDTVIPLVPNGHLYKATTVTGASGSSAPAWPTGAGSTVVDGGVTWTEQSTALLAGTLVEATYTGYARVSVAASLANFAGTQGAGTTTASSGTSGQTSNNGTITFGAPTANQAGVVCGVLVADASTAGNICVAQMLNTAKTINNGDAAPFFPAAAFTFTATPAS